MLGEALGEADQREHRGEAPGVGDHRAVADVETLVLRLQVRVHVLSDPDRAAGVRRDTAQALGQLGRAEEAAELLLALARDKKVDDLVRCDTAARNTSGALEWEYSSRKWCSTSQT